MPDATFMVSVATYEEKGSDVNVAPAAACRSAR